MSPKSSQEHSDGEQITTSIARPSKNNLFGFLILKQ